MRNPVAYVFSQVFGWMCVLVTLFTALNLVMVKVMHDSFGVEFSSIQLMGFIGYLPVDLSISVESAGTAAIIVAMLALLGTFFNIREISRFHRHFVE